MYFIMIYYFEILLKAEYLIKDQGEDLFKTLDWMIEKVNGKNNVQS